MLKPYWLSGLAIGLFLTWAWVWTALVRHIPGSFFPRFTSNPWFFFGLPILLALGMIVGAMVTHISRRWDSRAATVILLGLSLPWIVYDFTQTFPKPAAEKCLEFPLGTDAVTIEFHSRDSFDEGYFASGKFQVDPSVLRTILTVPKIKEIKPVPFSNEGIEEAQIRRVFKTERCRIEFDTETNILSFTYRSKVFDEGLMGDKSIP